MHGTKKFRDCLNLLFMFVQSTLFISAASLLIIFLVFYTKEAKMFDISFRLAIFLSLMCSFILAGSILGLVSINSKDRLNLVFYILILLFIINLQSVFILRLPKFTQRIKNNTLNIWKSMSEQNRTSFEENFNCCGFMQGKQRSSCTSKISCLKIFYKMISGFRSISEKILILFIFVESFSLALVCWLKLGRRVETK